MSSESKEAVKNLVQDLFRFLDARDFSAFLNLFESNATIIHDDGAATTPTQFVSSLCADSITPAKGRRLDGFIVGGSAGLAWVGYENHVTFEEKGGHVSEFIFSETAILVHRLAGWRFVRLHYSGKRIKDHESA